MAEGTRDQVAAIRRLVRRSTQSKTGNVAGRRGPLGKTARQLIQAGSTGGQGRRFGQRRPRLITQAAARRGRTRRV